MSFASIIGHQDIIKNKWKDFNLCNLDFVAMCSPISNKDTIKKISGPNGRNKGWASFILGEISNDPETLIAFVTHCVILNFVLIK